MSRPYNLVGRKHPALHQPAARVDNPQDVTELANRMLATVRVRRGHALAAPQVGVSLQLVVLANGNALVNPSVDSLSDEEVTGVEACLSLPGHVFLVPRPTEVQVSGQTLDGDLVDLEVEGIDARAWCHELDHLAGVLISDKWPETRSR